MLELKNIKKVYNTGGFRQVALDDVTLNFRDSEFVSILGPSGSGKTTLLNIIGGLDKYDSGELIIGNKSTKNYKDRDWDSYRNHGIGFIFQNYNLIPHQTILRNVMLALTISGISKKRGEKLALDALESVGLKEHAHKRPNQLSGGQMQRVAIARALVNNPKIILADEPTGALDSKTSVQVMEILKNIASDRLVIMVTHNPELAKKYSNRIVNLKDGKITKDSHPYTIRKRKEAISNKNFGKSSMGILTAFGLSLNNLLTKKGRTILTSFAGSIGIIGIALILSLSNGFQKYIDKVQEDALTSYPLTISKTTADTTSLLLSTMKKEEDEELKDEEIKETKNIENMFSSVGKNDIASFKKYLDGNKEKIDKMVLSTNYYYDIVPYVYTKREDKIVKVNPSNLFNMRGNNSSNYSGMSNRFGIFNELDTNIETTKKKYDILKGRLPEKFNEMVIILPDEHHISDMLLYSIGIKDNADLEKMITKLSSGEKIETDDATLKLTYDDLLNLKFKLINNYETFKYNSKYNIYEDMSNDEKYMKELYNKGLDLKIVGILILHDNNNLSALTSGVGYTSDLTKYIIDNAKKSEIVKKQLNNKEVNVFSGKRFDDKSTDSGINFNNLISVNAKMLQSAFNIKINNNELQKITNQYLNELKNEIAEDAKLAKNNLAVALKRVTTKLLEDYVRDNHLDNIDVANMKLEDVDTIVDKYMNSGEMDLLIYSLERQYNLSISPYKNTFGDIIKLFLKSYISVSSIDENNVGAISKDKVDELVKIMTTNTDVNKMIELIANNLAEKTVTQTIPKKINQITAKVMKAAFGGLKVDQKKIAKAFKFNLTEDDIKRIFMASNNDSIADATSNLVTLGYQDLEEPSSIAFYFRDFASKEAFVDFLEDYNKKMGEVDEDKVIRYVDLTSVLTSSVKVIVDSVSYVLIAFVSISLIVSSIMIGIITYISVLERTKEIGILRAMGASKRNVSSIFNAETFIVGFLSGLIGVGVSFLLLIPINALIHHFTNNPNIVAILPIGAAIILVILSVILTLIGGLIPSRKASKQDPVLALRSE